MDGKETAMSDKLPVYEARVCPKCRHEIHDGLNYCKDCYGTVDYGDYEYVDCIPLDALRAELEHRRAEAMTEPERKIKRWVMLDDILDWLPSVEVSDE